MNLDQPKGIGWKVKISAKLKEIRSRLVDWFLKKYFLASEIKYIPGNRSQTKLGNEDKSMSPRYILIE